MLKKILKRLPLALACILLGLWGRSAGEFLQNPQIQSAYAHEGMLKYVRNVHGRHSIDVQYVTSDGKDHTLFCGTAYHGELCPMLWRQHNTQVRVTFNDISIGGRRVQVVAEARDASGKLVYQNTKVTTRAGIKSLDTGVLTGLTLYMLAFYLLVAIRRQDFKSNLARHAAPT